MLEAAGLPELGQCNDQLTQGQLAFGKLSSAPVSVACLSNGIDTGFFPNFILSHPIVGGVPAAQWDYGPGPTYDSYAECMAARENIGSQFASATGQAVGGVLCTSNGDYTPRFDATVLYQPMQGAPPANR
jgi:hypothetical protein